MLYTHSDDSPKSCLSKVRTLFPCPAKKRRVKFPYHNKQRFIPHPGEFPISYRRAECTHSAINIPVENPYVGLSFQGDDAVESGTVLDVTIRVGCEDHTFRGQVVWVRPLDRRHEFGLCFAHEDDAFRVRNLEQVCHIEIYRRRLCEINGCSIDVERAAQEWIEKFSAQFPKLFAGS